MILTAEQEKRLARYSCAFLSAARSHLAARRKLPTIENAKLVFPDSGIGQVVAGFDFEGARFHVWLENSAGRLWEHGDTLYKNPPLGVERKSAADFPTRSLDTTKHKNVLLLAALFLSFDFDAEAAKARTAVREKRAADKREMVERAKAGIVCEHSAALHLALDNLWSFPADAGYRADAHSLLARIADAQEACERDLFKNC